MRYKSATIIIILIFIVLTLSCNDEEIVIPHSIDLTPLSKIHITPINSIKNSPQASIIHAKDGRDPVNNEQFPDGIMDWLEYDISSSSIHREANINVYFFIDNKAAKEYMDFESVHHWYKPRLDKFVQGALSNGITYCASYIQQHRSDPEGCNLPMQSYGSFLILRNEGLLLTIDVHETDIRNPQGITKSDIAYIEKLLTDVYQNNSSE